MSVPRSQKVVQVRCLYHPSSVSVSVSLSQRHTHEGLPQLIVTVIVNHTFVSQEAGGEEQEAGEQQIGKEVHTELRDYRDFKLSVNEAKEKALVTRF